MISHILEMMIIVKQTMMYLDGVGISSEAEDDSFLTVSEHITIILVIIQSMVKLMA